MIKPMMALLAALLFCASVFAQTKPIVGAAQIEQYLNLLEDKRVSLVVNATSQVGQTHLLDVMLEQQINVVNVMGPEHGFRGDAGAGEKITDGVDAKTGIPILSLYGATRKPTAQMLANIDIIVFDIQDVGARFYTYISTLHYVMEAAAEHNIEVLVLDRPNPNGRFVQGPVRQNEYKSFVGMHPIPLLHGMTVGEVARMIKGEAWINQSEQLMLHVIPVKHYARTQDYVLPIAPSPNLPNQQSIRLYPSLCLFEATVVSIGRGTDFPFQVIGHDTVKLGEFTFNPTSRPNSAPNPKLQGKVLYGQDLRSYSMAGFDLTLLVEVYQKFKQQGIALIDRPEFFDLLAGTDAIRKGLESGQTAEQIAAQWQTEIDQFKRLRSPYLLYP